MEIEDRLDHIKSFFGSKQVAEEGLLPVSDEEVREEVSNLGTYTEPRTGEEEDSFGSPSPELLAAFQ